MQSARCSGTMMYGAPPTPAVSWDVVVQRPQVALQKPTMKSAPHFPKFRCCVQVKLPGSGTSTQAACRPQMRSKDSDRNRDHATSDGQFVPQQNTLAISTNGPRTCVDCGSGTAATALVAEAFHEVSIALAKGLLLRTCVLAQWRVVSAGSCSTAHRVFQNGSTTTRCSEFMS
jgi:hypothetical protein